MIKKFYFIISFFIAVNFCYSKNIDSCKYNITINYNTRKFNSLDEYYEKGGPFDNNRIRSITLNFEAIFAETKKYQFITNYGINFRTYTVGYLSETGVLRESTGDIMSNSFAIGFQTGIAVQRKIFKYKNTNLYLSGGFSFNGFMINGIKDENFLFKYSTGSFSDSITVYHDSHKPFYFYPMLQLKIKSKVGKKILVYGTRMLKGTDLSSKLNIRYRVGTNRNPNSFQYKGTFYDYRNQWEFYLGLAF